MIASMVMSSCNGPSSMNTSTLTATATVTSGSNSLSLRFAQIAIPDQVVGGKILTAVYSRLNIPIELVDVPANRALIESSKGRMDGEVQRNIKVQEQYPTLIALFPPINYIEPSVFSKRFRFPVNGWASIKDYEIGIVRGVGTSENGTQGMKKVRAIETLDQLLKMLDDDRLEVVVTDLFSGQVALKKLNLKSTIYPLSPPLEKIYTYHFLHQKHRDIIPKVERILQEMRVSGELEELRKEFIDQLLSLQE